MSSQYLKKVQSQGMEEKMSEAIDGTMNTSEDNLNDSFTDVLDPDRTSTNGEITDLYHLRKKAKVAHGPSSSFEASSNKTDSADSNTLNSSICSNDHNAANILQSSQSRICPEKLSSGRQSTTAPEEYLAKTVHSISEYEASDDELLSPPASETFHAKYRKSSPDLMTLHMFTGKMNGKTPIYVPVYKRNSFGKLLKLMERWSGHWEYMELKKLTEEELDAGLKTLEKPKAEVVLQSSEPKIAVGRRKLADFSL